MEDLNDDIVNGIATADVTETPTPELLHVSDIDIAINATRIERVATEMELVWMHKSQYKRVITMP